MEQIKFYGKINDNVFYSKEEYDKELKTLIDSNQNYTASCRYEKLSSNEKNIELPGIKNSNWDFYQIINDLKDGKNFEQCLKELKEHTEKKISMFMNLSDSEYENMLSGAKIVLDEVKKQMFNNMKIYANNNITINNLINQNDIIDKQNDLYSIFIDYYTKFIETYSN
jgi:hypothetical protein